MFSMATKFLPAWVKANQRLPQGHMSLNALYGELSSPLFVIPQLCQPELFTVSNPRCPGLNGELKSVNPAVLFDEALEYTYFAMVHSFFPQEGTERLFYSQPPRGYALLGVAYLAHFMVLELVGKLFASPYTDPFFLGTSGHKKAVASLEGGSYDEPVDLSNCDTWVNCATLGNLVQWTPKPFEGGFVKIILAYAYDEQKFRAIYQAYAKLAQLAPSTWESKPTEPPRALLPKPTLWAF
jgi:hypothetical protein